MIASTRAAPQRGPGWIPGARHAWPRPASSSSPGHLWIRGQLTPHNPRRLSPCVDRPVDNYTLVFPHLCPQMWMNHRGVLSALSFMAARAAQCFSGAVRLMCCLLASETLARTGVRGRLVVLEARVRSKGRGLAGPGRSLVSTALTSTPHRRCTPKKNRRIPTIPAGNIGGWIVHVSAVDTGPRGSESGLLTAEPGAVAVWNHRHSCLRPCVICRTQPPPPGGPSPFVGRAADRPRPSPRHLGAHHTSPTS